MTTTAASVNIIRMTDDTTLLSLAEKVGQFLKDTGRHMVTAESCTGGWIAKALTDVPGSSDWFDCGYITYNNAAKLSMLGVSPKALETDGAVSESVVSDMAQGALARSGVHVAVACSGIAGPTGAVPGKPVGTVWLAWSAKQGDDIKTITRLAAFSGDRESIRRQTVRAALEGLLYV